MQVPRFLPYAILYSLAATFVACLLDYYLIGAGAFGWLTYLPALALAFFGAWLVFIGIVSAVRARRASRTLVVFPPVFLSLAGWRLPAVNPLVVERLALAGLVAVILVVALACLVSARKPAAVSPAA